MKVDRCDHVSRGRPRATAADCLGALNIAKIPTMTNSQLGVPTKTCACTGVRWCASCREPRVRRRHGMDDPLRIPDLLSTRPRDAGQIPNPRDVFHDFGDLMCSLFETDGIVLQASTED